MAQLERNFFRRTSSVGDAFVPVNRGQTPPGSAAGRRRTASYGKENLERGWLENKIKGWEKGV